MNSFTKKVAKFSLIVFIIGIVISIIALSLGGKIINLSTHNLEDIVQTYSDVESLNINLDASDIEVKIGNEFKIEASNISNETFKSYIQNGEWNIQDKITSKWFNINNNNSKVIIYIPEDINFSKLKINIGAGRFIADKLNATTTNINVGAGEFKIYDLLTDEINIDCGVGNIEINGTVNNKGYINSGVGSVSLNLKGNAEDYNYDLSLGIGEVTLNGKDFGGFGKKIVENNSGNKEFKIECGIGKVSLDINK